ncbi:MAG: SprB repeat-containing protein, partial [Chitinophagales bacterium]|nr:SprB repeat-containing protein [Chitinophagales bacterium]
ATCTAVTSYTVNEPTALSVVCSKTDVTTNSGSDGTASVNATGGTSPYTYLWSSGETASSISGKTAGTYSVTVTDNNGCSDQCTTTIQEPGCNLSATTTGTDVSCNGGSDGTANVTASGNLSPVTYLWSNGETTASISGLTAGTYSVTVTENATCTAVTSYTVNEPTALSVVCSKTDVTTNGGSDGTASVNATGGTSPYTYLWSSGETASSISGKTAGTYSVTVTDNNGCTVTCSSTINEPGALCNLTASGLADVTCNNNGTTADASDDYISFTLNPTGTTLGSSYVITVSSGSITPTTAGYGQTTTFQLQNGSAGSGNTITITITDDIDTNCKVQVDIPDTGSCSTPSCPPIKCLPVMITKQ